MGNINKTEKREKKKRKKNRLMGSKQKQSMKSGEDYSD